MAGQLRVDEITDEAGTGAPSFPVGNVGIGTSSPDAIFEVRKSSNLDARFTTASGSGLQITQNSSAGSPRINVLGAGLDFVIQAQGTEQMRVGSNGDFLFNSGYGSAVVAFGCRAWVNFNGGTVSIKGSGGVSSVTRSATGVFVVNLSTTMPDTNYAWSGSMKGVTNNDGQVSENRDVSRSTTSLPIIVRDSSTNDRNSPETSVIIFR